MNTSDILKVTDHTLLKQDSTWEQIKEIIDDAVKFGTASVCIPPSFVERASKYASGRMKICTVIGFPNGYNTTAVKCFEAAEAVRLGADEIDMVIDIGMVKEKRYTDLLAQIKAVKESCSGRLLKVIIETCLLSDEEKTEMCRVVSESGADYIKTSTGFSTAGATREDVALFAENIAPHVKIKAAGGIASLADAEDFIRLGASRLGTSRIVKAVKDMK